jgi:hypothetical protein
MRHFFSSVPTDSFAEKMLPQQKLLSDGNDEDNDNGDNGDNGGEPSMHINKHQYDLVKTDARSVFGHKPYPFASLMCIDVN